jgi:hypothetical protein
MYDYRSPCGWDRAVAGKSGGGLICALGSFELFVSAISDVHGGDRQAASRFLHGHCFVPFSMVVSHLRGAALSLGPPPFPSGIRPADWVAGVASLREARSVRSQPPLCRECGVWPRWFAVTTIGPLPCFAWRVNALRGFAGAVGPLRFDPTIIGKPPFARISNSKLRGFCSPGWGLTQLGLVSRRVYSLPKQNSGVDMARRIFDRRTDATPACRKTGD